MSEQFPVDERLLDQYIKTVDLINFPKGFLQWYDAASLDERRRWYTARYQCLKYHMYLQGYVKEIKAGAPDLAPTFVPIMGMDFQPEPHDRLFAQYLQKRPGEGIVLSDLDTVTKKRMILWPRGVFKTSSIIVEIIQCILNYPDISICFLTGGHPLAKRQLAKIKRVFERPTVLFRWLFPEFCLVSRPLKKRKRSKAADGTEISEIEYEDITPKFGTTTEFTIPCRTNSMIAEPTFAISTAKSVKSGSHFDMIFIDDLVNDQNYRSVKALEKCYNDYLDICPVLDPHGFMIVTGTRYSFGDTYERLQEMAKEEEKQLGGTIWKFSIRDCWSTGCQNCVHSDVYHDYSINVIEPPCTHPDCHCTGFKARGNKGVLFPLTRTRAGKEIGHTVEWLKAEQVRTGPEFFANQYENKPIATGTQTFTEALLGRQTLHHEVQLPTFHQARIFAIGDLAYVGQEGRDYSVIFIVRVFQGQIFVVDCFFGNWDSNAVAENTFRILMKHRPEKIYFEKFNGWEAYHNVISAYCREKGLDQLPLEWLPGSQALNAKLIRIGASKGPLQQRRLWLYSPMPGYALLTNQLVKWPKLGRHDDFADALGMVVAAPTNYQMESPPQISNPLHWLNKLHQVQVIEDQYYDGGGGTGICM